MINLEKDTPIEYSKQSRDYQVFTFLYNALFNQGKMYVDLVKNIWTDNIDSKLLDLRAYTLNFIPKFEWENSDLLGVTNCFRYLLRTKGTTGAIKKALEILSRIKGIKLLSGGTEPVIVEDGIVKLLVSEEIDDLGNIEDLLRYILPAGMGYEIIKYAEIDSTVGTDIVVDSLFDVTSEYENKELYIPTSEDTYAIKRIINSLARYETGMLVTSESIADNYITNDTTKLTISKSWDDNNDADGQRGNVQSYIQVFAKYPDGTERAITDPIEVDPAKTFSIVLDNLQVTDKGKAIVYRVEETGNYDDYDYEVRYSPESVVAKKDNSGTLIVVNKRLSDVMSSLIVNKIWDDDNNRDGIRPENIGIQLYRKTDSIPDFKYGNEVKTNQESGWSVRWEDLPVNLSGEQYTYHVKEFMPITSGYTQIGLDSEVKATKGGNGVINITNRHVPYRTSLTVNKRWNDNLNNDGKRSDVKAKITLKANEAEIGTVNVGDSENWSTTFSNLYVNENGQPINYKLIETFEDGTYYVAEESEQVWRAARNPGRITFTNTHELLKTSIKVSKTWDDADNQDGKRPNNAFIQLYADNVAIPGKRIRVPSSDGQIVIWNDLNVYKNGNPITYKVVETLPSGIYTKSGDSENIIAQENSENEVIITNSYVPKVTNIIFKKIWNDDDDRDGKRIDLATNSLVNIYNNSELIVSSILPNIDSEATFTVPVYKDGRKVLYKVDEVLKSGTNYSKSDYVMIQANEVETSGTATITNSYTPEKITYFASLSWDDDDDRDGLRDNFINGFEMYSTADNSELDRLETLLPNSKEYFKYRDHGTLIDYDVELKNDSESKYVVTSSESPINTFSIIAKHEPEEVDVKVDWRWQDGNDIDNTRNNSINKIRLFITTDGSDKYRLQLTDDDTILFNERHFKYKNHGTLINYGINASAGTSVYRLVTSEGTSESEYNIIAIYNPNYDINFNAAINWDSEGSEGAIPVGSHLDVYKIINGVETLFKNYNIPYDSEGVTVDDTLESYNDGILLNYRFDMVLPDGCGYESDYDSTITYPGDTDIGIIINNRRV